MPVYRIKEELGNGEVQRALDEIAREGARLMLARALEEEVEEFLGRRRYQRRGQGTRPGSRNGYGKLRKMSLGCGTIEIRAPRVRDTDEPFRSALLPRFRRSSDEVRGMIPALYLHGLATGDFEPALRGLLGEAAPLSPSSVVRLKAQWQQEYAAWKRRALQGVRYAYLWADGLYLKAGLADDKAALLVVIGVNQEGEKELLAMMEGYRESAESWKEVLRDLKGRGLEDTRLIIGDGALGLWAAVREVYPGAREQHCWCHKILNVLDKLPKRCQPEAKAMLRDIYHAPGREEAEARIQRFADRFAKEYPRAVESLRRNQEQLLTFYDFPRAHWKSLKTTNPIESVFDQVRLRTNATRRMRSAQTALYLVFQLVRHAQSRWRRIDGAHLVIKVLDGVRFINGQEEVKASVNQVAA